MGMDDWFDNLAKDSAQRLSRRQVFGRLLAGTGVAAFSVFGLRKRDAPDKNCVQICKECCHTNNSSGGVALGQCISACEHGEGTCWDVAKLSC